MTQPTTWLSSWLPHRQTTGKTLYVICKWRGKRLETLMLSPSWYMHTQKQAGKSLISFKKLFDSNLQIISTLGLLISRNLFHRPTMLMFQRLVTDALMQACMKLQSCFTTTFPTLQSLLLLWFIWKNIKALLTVPERLTGKTNFLILSKTAFYTKKTYFQHSNLERSLLCLCWQQRVPTCPDVWSAHSCPCRWARRP